MARKKVEKNIAYDNERKTYYVTLNWGKDAAGKYRKTTATTTNLREAKKILKEHEAMKAAGKAVPPASELLVDAVEHFIRYKALSLAETTIYGYNNIFRNHVKPYFQGVKLQAVTLQMLQDYRLQKAAEELSDSTISKHFTLLYSVFKDACKKKLVQSNPVELMDRVSVKSKKKTCMNAAELAELLASMEHSSLKLPVYLAGYLGLRRGEVIGLRWMDLDLERNLLYVNNTRTKAGGSIVEKDPKTEKSQRVVRFPEEVRMVLMEAKEKQETRRKINRRYVDSGYVFTKESGAPYSPNYLSEAFTRHVKRMGMKQVRFHDLRHSFASIANEAGIALTEISSTLGHSSPSVTSQYYMHEFSPEKVVAVNAVAQSIARAKQ